MRKEIRSGFGGDRAVRRWRTEEPASRITPYLSVREKVVNLQARKEDCKILNATYFAPWGKVQERETG